jgi:hypothetical protein
MLSKKSAETWVLNLLFIVSLASWCPRLLIKACKV